MKNLILLLLVIGAAVSQIALTTLAAQKWTLTYVSASTSFYSFTLSYEVTGAAVPASYLVAASSNMGVVCIPTLSTFAINTTARAGFTFTVDNGAGGAAANNAEANWLPLKLISQPTMTYANSGSISTGTAADGTVCPIVIPAVTGGNTADFPTFSSGVVTWAFTVATPCGVLPAMGAAWYAKCYAVASVLIGTTNVDDIAGAAVALTTVGENNVTVAATTTVCAVSGASTFATGATILAGIAYLQL
jgi:hypothetical protein